MKHSFISVLLLLTALCQAQVNITTGSYDQDFGTANITSWTNNSTFPGWYISGTFQGNTNLSASANSYNSGGFYAYNCGSDSKIGSRASGSASNLYYGVVLRNTTGQAIRSIRVSYTGYQMSLATNGNNINTIAFDYVVSTTAPAITAGGGTGVTALNFQQLQNSSTSGGNQLNWYPCTQSRALSSCIPVTIANNSYILLRWRDVDDSGNDHHMAIDDIQVDFDMTGGACAVFLPVELMYFNATYNGAGVNLGWATASETNNSHFTIERSSNGIDFEALMQVKGTAAQSGKAVYEQVDTQPLQGLSYYRLRQTDKDGRESYSAIEAVTVGAAPKVKVFPNPTSNGKITIEAAPASTLMLINSMGQVVSESLMGSAQEEIDLAENGKGIYTLIIHSGAQTSVHKVVCE